MDLVINGRFLTHSITGVQRYARELLQALDVVLDTRPELQVTAMSPRLSSAPPVWRNIKLQQVGYLRGHAWEQIELPWYCRGKTLFCPANMAPIISLLCAQAIVVTVHDLSYRYFPEAYSRSFRLWYGATIPLILHQADAVITVSASERRAIIESYPKVATRLYAIQNGGLPASFDVSLTGPANADPGYVLYVGSLSKRKNFPGVLDVAIRLARKRNFQFVIVGGVPGGISNTDLTVPIDLTSRITFAGQVNDPATLASYYKNAACFLFPSFYEASPLPPIEAMACGCPVVASDIASLRERCGDAAVYCNPFDIDAISTAIERVMDNPALHLRLKEDGIRRAALFTWKRCAQQTLDIICQSDKRKMTAS